MSVWSYVQGTIQIDGVSLWKLTNYKGHDFYWNKDKHFLDSGVPYTLKHLDEKYKYADIIFNFDELNKNFIKELNNKLCCGSEGPVELSYCTFDNMRKNWGSDGSSCGSSDLVYLDGKLIPEDTNTSDKAFRLNSKENGTSFAINLCGMLRNCEINELEDELNKLIYSIADMYNIRELLIRINSYGREYIYTNADVDVDRETYTLKSVKCNRIVKTLNFDTDKMETSEDVILIHKGLE